MARHIGIILIVGAICVILAVIFFPVFAQAKQAAAKSSPVSIWKRRALEAESRLADYESTGSDSPLHDAARQPGATRSVARQGTLAVEVESLDKAEKQMDANIHSVGAYVDHLESDDLAGELPSMRLVIRVPEKSFDALLTSFESLGRRTQKSISASDLTEQILDATAQIKEAEPAGPANAERIKQLQDEHDQLAGRAAMSTIELTLQQKANAATAAAANSSWGSDTWNAALSSAMDAFRVIGALAIWLLVFSPIWGGCLAVTWAIVRLVKRHGRPATA